MNVIGPEVKYSSALAHGFSMLNEENRVPFWKSDESLGRGIAPWTNPGTASIYIVIQKRRYKFKHIN